MFEKLVAWYSRLPFPRRKPGLLRLVSWAERLRGARNWATAKVNTPAGSVFLEVDLNAWLQREMFYHGVFEPDIQFAIQAYCKPGATVCDVGANIGVYTTQMSKLVGQNGTVIAFEPTAKFHARLTRNLELNSCRNVVVNKLIVSDHVGTHEISISDQTASINLLSDCEQKETIESTTLDIHLKDIDSLSFMKIDVDGWDFHVLNGAQQIIQKHRPLIIVECTRGENSEPQRILELLTDLDYGVYLDSDRKQTHKLSAVDFERLAVTQNSFNVIAIHAQSTVIRERLH